MIDFASCKPQYDVTGSLVGVSHAGGYWPLDHRWHREFCAWVAARGQTLEQWWQEHPAPVAPEHRAS